MTPFNYILVYTSLLLLLQIHNTVLANDIKDDQDVRLDAKNRTTCDNPTSCSALVEPSTASATDPEPHTTVAIGNKFFQRVVGLASYKGLGATGGNSDTLAIVLIVLAAVAVGLTLLVIIIIIIICCINPMRRKKPSSNIEVQTDDVPPELSQMYFSTSLQAPMGGTLVTRRESFAQTEIITLPMQDMETETDDGSPEVDRKYRETVDFMPYREPQRLELEEAAIPYEGEFEPEHIERTVEALETRQDYETHEQVVEYPEEAHGAPQIEEVIIDQQSDEPPSPVYSPGEEIVYRAIVPRQPEVAGFVAEDEDRPTNPYYSQPPNPGSDAILPPRDDDPSDIVVGGAYGSAEDDVIHDSEGPPPLPARPPPDSYDDEVSDLTGERTFRPLVLVDSDMRVYGTTSTDVLPREQRPGAPPPQRMGLSGISEEDEADDSSGQVVHARPVEHYV